MDIAIKIWYYFAENKLNELLFIYNIQIEVAIFSEKKKSEGTRKGDKR